MKLVDATCFEFIWRYHSSLLSFSYLSTGNLIKRDLDWKEFWMISPCFYHISPTVQTDPSTTTTASKISLIQSSRECEYCRSQQWMQEIDIFTDSKPSTAIWHISWWFLCSEFDFYNLSTRLDPLNCATLPRGRSSRFYSVEKSWWRGWKSCHSFARINPARVHHEQNS